MFLQCSTEGLNACANMAKTSGRLLFIATSCLLVLIVRCAWRSRATYLAETAICGNEEDCGQNDKKNAA
jgi:hypothetical protein